MATKLARAKFIAGTLIAVAIVGFGSWQHYQSPSQVAKRQLAQAMQAKAAGQWVQAAELFAEVAQSRSDFATDGATGLGGLLDATLLQSLPAADAAKVLRQVPRARATGQSPMPARNVATLGWSLIAAHAAKNPIGAKDVLDAIAPMEVDKAKLAAGAEPLLERIVAADPKHAAAAIEYAGLLDLRRDCARCEALLAPHTAVLAGGEGARILGQIYASKGLLDESYALLQPYTAEKLTRFLQREAEYNDSSEAIRNAAIETLRNGRAPEDFYKRYDASDETAKRELVSVYVDEQLSGNAALKSALQALREAAGIVPVALDLGIVTVQRAHKLTDPSARKVQFEAAEKVFLSIRGVAGNSDGYRLYLGQVSYWVGKQDEGKKLFDELLAAHSRAPGILLEVANLLRSVGAVQQARTLVEEAYENSKDREQRWYAALFRSVMNTEAEDELAWLERSDRSLGRVRASIHATRARLANDKGQRSTAKREYESAAAEFEKLPESAVKLNSLASIHLALYGMEGDPRHRDLGLAQLDQALALQPTDSILLLNNVAAVTSAAAAAMVGETIDLPMLRSPGDLAFLEFLHNDEPSRERVRHRLRENEAVKKGLAYSEKAILLAPRNPVAYAFPVTIAGLLEDASAMKAITARAKGSQLDLLDQQNRNQKITDGSDRKQMLDAIAANNQEWAELLRQPALQRQPATWAVAAGRWVDAQIATVRWGQPIDADALVKTARKARAGQPSAGTQSMLLAALETRAVLRLMKAHAPFASDVAKHARAIDLSILLTVHMDEDPEFRRLALADADLAEIRTLLHDRDKRYPSQASLWAWLMFRHVDAPHAQSLATRVRRDDDYAARVELGAVFAPRDADAAITRYHLALAGGDRPGAQRVLEDARQAGIPLPEVLGLQLKL